jgi:hypothetical protein
MNMLQMERSVLRGENISEISNKIQQRLTQLDFIMERFIDNFDEELQKEEFKYTRFLRAKSAEYSNLNRLNRIIVAKECV